MRARLGKANIESGTAILFNAKQLDRKLNVIDCKFCNWMTQLGSRDNHPVDADNAAGDDNDEDNADDFNRIDVSGGVGTIAEGELFPSRC